MSVPARVITPEALEEARRLYETTRVPVRQVADLLGVSRWTLNDRSKRWGWKRRATRIPRDMAGGPDAPAETPGAERQTPRAASGAGAARPLAADKAAIVEPPLSRAALIARLVQRVEQEIGAVERLVAMADKGGEARVAAAERAARTLAILVRSLRELAALEKNEPDGDDDAGRDADAFRRELGETLERVLAAGAAG